MPDTHSEARQITTQNSPDQSVDPLAAARAEIARHLKHDADESVLQKVFSAISSNSSDTLSALQSSSAEYSRAFMQGGAAAALPFKAKLDSQLKSDREALQAQDRWVGYGTEFVKTMALFSRGMFGAVALGAYSLDAMHPDDSASAQVFDGALGYAKGLALKTVLSKVGQTDLPLAVKGASMGLLSRGAEVALDRHSYLDRDGNFKASAGWNNISAQLVDGNSLLIDGAMFVAAHGLVKGSNVLTRGWVERSAVASTAATAFSFGLLSGSTQEVQQQVKEGKTLSTFDYGSIAAQAGIHAVLDGVASAPGGMQAQHELNQKINVLTGNHQFASIVGLPKDLPRAIADLKAELQKEVPVQRDGKLTDPYTLIESDPEITPGDKRLIWSALASARESFKIMENKVPKESPASGYQWEMNWKHTRGEFAEAWEAAKTEAADRRANGEAPLTSAQVRNAMIASIFSDHIKTPGPRAAGGNFIIHNVHGAQASAEVMASALNPNRWADLRSIEQIHRGILEHQVAPPRFMAQMAAGAIARELGYNSFDRKATSFPGANPQAIEHQNTLNSIFDKIDEPFDAANLTADKTRLKLTAKERELTSKVGIEDWYVPHPDNRDSFVARIVVPADHSINYNTPDGLAKFLFIREPGKEAIFKDPTFDATLDSVIGPNGSFFSSRRVLDAKYWPGVDDKYSRTLKALARTKSVMNDLFNQTQVEQQGMTGEERIAKAFQTARAANPDLFENVDDQGRTPEERAYRNDMNNRVGELLDAWTQRHGAIPVNPDLLEHQERGTAGKLPYWNTDLTYPLVTLGGGSSLSDLAQTQFDFARVISHIGVELLRGEHWRY